MSQRIATSGVLQHKVAQKKMIKNPFKNWFDNFNFFGYFRLNGNFWANPQTGSVFVLVKISAQFLPPPQLHFIMQVGRFEPFSPVLIVFFNYAHSQHFFYSNRCNLTTVRQNCVQTLLYKSMEVNI